ncbi:MAG: hypothetical protein M9962_05490 [Oligoflexia bacterium]|nr:hypothetical protein [Oligoflexia bacterium]
MSVLLSFLKKNNLNLDEIKNPKVCFQAQSILSNPLILQLEEQIFSLPGNHKNSINEFGEIPLPDTSQNFILTNHFIEQLTKPQLYMFLAELRRIIKKDSYWLYIGNKPSDSILAKILTTIFFFKKAPLIQIWHFISPEYWQLIDRIEINQVKSSIEVALYKAIE